MIYGIGAPTEIHTTTSKPPNLLLIFIVDRLHLHCLAEGDGSCRKPDCCPRNLLTLEKIKGEGAGPMKFR